MIKKAGSVLLAGAAAAAVLAWSVNGRFDRVAAQEAKAQGEEKQGHPKAHDHIDMFTTTDDPRLMRIDDPRFKVREVEYTPLAATSIADHAEGDQPAIDAGNLNDQVYVLLQGDMILGTEQELLNAAASRSSALSSAVMLDERPPGEEAAAPIDELHRQALEQIQGAAPPRTQATRSALATGALVEAAFVGSHAGKKNAAYLERFGQATRGLRAEAEKNQALRAPTPLPPRERSLEQVVGFKEAPTPANALDERAMFSAVTNNATWPNGVVPWQFHSTFPQAQRQRVRDAIAHWHQRTDRIHFVGRTLANAGTFSNFIVFVPSDGCSARVGMSPSPGPQAVNLAPACETQQVIHELGHVVGLLHEMTRNGRDFDIQIDFRNIDRRMAFNFQEIGATGRNVGPFDWDSIMLYPRFAFTSTGRPTMVKPGSTDQNFGIASGTLGGRTTTLSDGDIAGVAAMYFSPANPPNPAHTN